MTDKQRKKLIERCMEALRINPNCVWARNELKWLDVPPITGSPVLISRGGYIADNNYHGGYTE
ncbi:MAG: hypothetical protein IKO55_05690 [Kiritimatiellae bacterium]|nr:hypothetical protein [Kiritimatiellia bacterium]